MTTISSASMGAEVRRWRDARRADMLSVRCAVPLAQRRRWDQTITQRMQTQFEALAGMVVGAYWPFRGEFDPRFLLRRLRHRGSRVALPVVVGRNVPLQFREWWPGAPMVEAVLGLPVPNGTELLTPDALLIPPVGFDEQGYRLGYGGGYFDRTLAAMNPQTLKIGVAFELSRMPSIRPQPHDIAMDFIVTENGVYRVVDECLVLVDSAWRWR